MRKFYAGMALFFAAVIGRWFWLKRAVPKTPVRVYPALATSIPADTKILAGWQVEQVKKTKLYQRLVEERKIPAIEKFVSATGIDPRRNVYEIVLASNGEDSIIFASGKFAELSSSTGQSTAELRPHAQIGGERMVRMPYKGMTLIGNPNAAACFLNNATVMAGRTGALKRVIDLREKNPTPPAGLLAALKELPAKDPFWLVSTLGIDETLPNFAIGGFRLRSVPVKLDRILASGDVASGIQLRITLESRDAKSIEQMTGALKSLIGIGRLNTPENQPDVLRFLDSIQVSSDAKGVQVVADVPEDLVERFLNSREFVGGLPAPVP